MTQYVNSIDGTVDYTNDAAGQLTGADYTYQTDESYVYDDNGNRVTANGDTYITGDNNQLLSDGTYTYLYDAEGNRTAKFVDSGNTPGVLDSEDIDITIHEWDHRNRLTAVNHYISGGYLDEEDPDRAVYYSYDAFNRLVARTNVVQTHPKDITETTVFVHDAGQIVLQFDAYDSGVPDALTAADLSHRYLCGPAVDQILADETVAPGEDETPGTPDDVLWPLTDHLNTVRDLATYDEALDFTTIANHRVYDAYGNVTSETNAATDCVFGFTGRLFDEATQLQNNLNRWYDPAVGRWASEDPIGFEGSGRNLYAYVDGGPTGNADPSGLEPAPCDLYGYPHDEVPLPTEVDQTWIADSPGIHISEALWDLFAINYDIDDKASFKPNDYLRPGQCIRNMIIVAHGQATYDPKTGLGYGQIDFGASTLTESYVNGMPDGSETSGNKTSFSDLFKGIRFCKPCTIDVRSCEMGKVHRLRKRIEAHTGCVVILHTGLVNADGVDKPYPKPAPPRFPGFSPGENPPCSY